MLLVMRIRIQLKEETNPDQNGSQIRKKFHVFKSWTFSLEGCSLKILLRRSKEENIATVNV
jgi:hypothetical protein